MTWHADHLSAQPRPASVPLDHGSGAPHRLLAVRAAPAARLPRSGGRGDRDDVMMWYGSKWYLVKEGKIEDCVVILSCTLSCVASNGMCCFLFALLLLALLGLILNA